MKKPEMSDPRGLKCDQMCHFDVIDARTKGDRKPFEKLRRHFERSPLKPSAEPRFSDVNSCSVCLAFAYRNIS